MANEVHNQLTIIGPQQDIDIFVVLVEQASWYPQELDRFGEPGRLTSLFDTQWTMPHDYFIAASCVFPRCTFVLSFFCAYGISMVDGDGRDVVVCGGRMLYRGGGWTFTERDQHFRGDCDAATCALCRSQCDTHGDWVRGLQGAAGPATS